METSKGNEHKVSFLLLAILFVVANTLTPAEAQTLKGTAISLFNTIYGVVGVLGALAILIAGLNWMYGNFLGVGNPSKLTWQATGGTALSFGVVAIVQWIKDAVSSGASINSL